MIDIVVNAVLIGVIVLTIGSLVSPKFYAAIIRRATRLEVEQSRKGRSAERSVAMVIIAAIAIYMLIVVNHR
jgi:dolichol kinase